MLVPFTVSLVDILRPACDAHTFHCLLVFEVAGMAEYIFKFWCLEVVFLEFDGGGVSSFYMSEQRSDGYVSIGLRIPTYIWVNVYMAAIKTSMHSSDSDSLFRDCSFFSDVI